MKRKAFPYESASSDTIEWYTPKIIFDKLNIQFDLDVCSPGPKIVPWIPAKKHLTKKEDGLLAPWAGSIWCNPPYGRECPMWLRRMFEHGNGIALVFARTDTHWFHDYCVRANAVLFIKKRVQFVRQDEVQAYLRGDKLKNKSSTAPSVLVAYGNKCEKALWNAKELGPVFKYHPAAK